MPQSDPYRRTFVGREEELRQLEQAFEAAVSGVGGLVTVVGEPGIGKTALCAQLASYVASRGGRTLLGHCYQEGSPSPPYIAFVEVIRSHVVELNLDDLRDNLGSGAEEVSRIVPEVRDLLQAEPRAASDPEEDRWRLLNAVTAFLRSAASAQPLAVVLEDLHWADSGTLDLLLHVARNLQDSCLLIVGTYRDEEVNRTHPLSTTLEELRRTGNFLRLPLRGLTVDEVHRMYEAIRENPVPLGQAELVHNQTEGNPLFVQEVLRYLVDEGIVVYEGGRYVARGDATAMPDGLRDVVGRRLNGLSETTNHVLLVAAVIGREFRLDLLQQAVGLSEEDLLQSLQEATDRAIIEQQTVVGQLGFSFRHALFRQTLYEEIFAPRRIRLHQLVGRVLEEAYPQRLEEHAAELAEHFSHSTENSDLEKAVHYSEAAARYASSVFAYGEAVRHLHQAIRAQEILEPDDGAKLCDLLLELGRAQIPAGEPQAAATTTADRAYDYAMGLQDSRRVCDAALAAIDALDHYGLGSSHSTPEYRRWAEVASQHAEHGTWQQVKAEVALAAVAETSGQPYADARAHRITALELARALGDYASMFQVAWLHLHLMLPQREDLETKLALATEAIGWPRDGVRVGLCAPVLWFCARMLLTAGQRDRAEAVWQEVDRLSRNTHDPTARRKALETEILLPELDGDLDAAAAAIDNLIAKREELGQQAGVNLQATLYSIRLASYLGRTLVSGEIAPHPVLIPLAEAYSGNRASAKQLLRSGRLHGETLDHLLRELDLAVLCQNKEVCAELVPQIEPFSHILGNWYFDPAAVGRRLADAEALLGMPEQARKHYNDALEVCLRVRFRPEIALARLGLAQLLLDHYSNEQTTAWELLDLVIPELEQMRMQPALEHAQALTTRLSESSTPARQQFAARKAGVGAASVTPKPAYPASLSARQMQVLRLIAEGKTTHEIAEELVLSERTVERHIADVYAKIDTRNRAEAATYAAQHGIA
ncbi:MAG TPA: AAA family ATPase [Dehalococcoidia bacterium]|nr:AAA family ATPase [Dehalococcoidia bacterium]